MVGAALEVVRNALTLYFLAHRHWLGMMSMRLYGLLPCLALVLPLSVQGADQEGWLESLRQELVGGCVASFKEAASADVRTELGRGASEALPPETPGPSSALTSALTASLRTEL